MSHSKRNTSLAFFTSYERSQLKAHWGSQSTRLSRDSFLSFGSCRLCLEAAVDPVACATKGHLFCRECALNNLLAQGKEIKRLDREDAKRKDDDNEREKERTREEHARAVEEFERTLIGEEGAQRMKEAEDALRNEIRARTKDRGVKRKFELDEDELLRNAIEERLKARKVLDGEKAAKQTLPSFWVPSLTPSTGQSINSRSLRLSPVCPSSSPETIHPLSLRTLVTVKFTTSASNLPQDKFSPDRPLTRVCPACKRALTNSLKAMLAIPCGHVLCQPCASKFMAPGIVNTSEDHDHLNTANDVGTVICYVCETDLTDRWNAGQSDDGKETPGEASEKANKKKGKRKKEESERVRPGLIELASEGTGFAGGGQNMAKKQGVAFQC